MHHRRVGVHQRQVFMHCAESVCTSAEPVSADPKSGRIGMRQPSTH
jgi:hypothetical protein